MFDQLTMSEADKYTARESDMQRLRMPKEIRHVLDRVAAEHDTHVGAVLTKLVRLIEDGELVLHGRASGKQTSTDPEPVEDATERSMQHEEGDEPISSLQLMSVDVDDLSDLQSTSIAAGLGWATHVIRQMTSKDRRLAAELASGWQAFLYPDEDAADMTQTLSLPRVGETPRPSIDVADRQRLTCLALADRTMHLAALEPDTLAEIGLAGGEWAKHLRLNDVIGLESVETPDTERGVVQ